MTAKRTSLIVAFLAAVVLGGNWWIVRSGGPGSCPAPTEDCQCVVRMFGKSASNPSCSVSGVLFGTNMLADCDTFGTSWTDRKVMCDKGIRAKLTCGSPGRTTEITVGAGSTIRVTCEDDGSGGKTVHDADSPWVKNTPQWNKPKPGGEEERIRRAAEGEPAPRRDTVITAMESLTVIDGDAGLEPLSNGTTRLTVLSGEAIVESFCRGSVARFSAPAFVTLSNTPDLTDILASGSADAAFCRVDVNGRWRGTYNRWNQGKLESVPATLEINGQTGTLQLGDTTLNISELRSDAESIRLRAVDQTRDLSLEGQISKSVIRFTTMDVSGSQYRAGSGILDRLYIAQWNVPAAALNTPYSHKLTAISPTKAPIVWRLASGSLPDGISFDQDTGTLTGTPNVTGNFPVVVEASDADGNSFRQPLVFKVKKFVVNTVLPDAVAGLPYKTTLTVTGGNPPYVWQSSIPIPGMEVSSSGELSAASAPAGGLGFFGRVTDSAGDTEQVMLGINVRKILIAGSQILPEAIAGSPYSYKFEALGPAGVKWSISPADPNEFNDLGLAFNAETGDLSGTPTRPASLALRVTATGGRDSISRDFVLPVNLPDGSTPATPSCAACGRK